jgi:hypothetical protein
MQTGLASKWPERTTLDDYHIILPGTDQMPHYWDQKSFAGFMDEALKLTQQEQ